MDAVASYTWRRLVSVTDIIKLDFFAWYHCFDGERASSTVKKSHSLRRSTRAMAFDQRARAQWRSLDTAIGRRYRDAQEDLCTGDPWCNPATKKTICVPAPTDLVSSQTCVPCHGLQTR